MKNKHYYLFLLPILAIVLLSSCSECSLLTSNKYKLNRVAIDHSNLKIEANVQTNPQEEISRNIAQPNVVSNDNVSFETTTITTPVTSKATSIKMGKILKDNLAMRTNTSNTTSAKIITKPSKHEVLQNKSIRNSLHDMMQMDTVTLVLLILLCLLVLSILGFMGLVNELIGIALLVLLILLILYLLKMI